MQMTASRAVVLALSNERGNIMKGILKWGLILLGCLVLLGALFGNKKDHAASSATQAAGANTAASAAVAATGVVPAATPPLAVTSVALAKAYEENEAAADNLYKGKLLVVSGKLQSINKDLTDDTVLVLQGQNAFQTVQAELDSDAASAALSMHKGQKVTLHCMGAGEVASLPMLKDCRLPAP